MTNRKNTFLSTGSEPSVELTTNQATIENVLLSRTNCIIHCLILIYWLVVVNPSAIASNLGPELASLWKEKVYLDFTCKSIMEKLCKSFFEKLDLCFDSESKAIFYSTSSNMLSARKVMARADGAYRQLPHSASSSTSVQHGPTLTLHCVWPSAFIVSF